VPVEAAGPFDCSAPRLRHPRETKGQDYNATTQASQCCDAGGCC
jgi:arsenite methyltransferase